ncbi:MBL fold metallo-hydrolase [Phenylobacterium sp.]|uniref:MBL fold metallo-hydrolase n=1 Tax=Phenylobacterium sp. TaxID=1871053 RepID=UPI00286CF955|nr:MBL fold metallo-hydrolase [Phenylobacterium sp.]
MFQPSQTRPRSQRARGVAIGSVSAVIALALSLGGPAPAHAEAPPGAAGAPYAGMPAMAPIGVRPDRYLQLPQGAAGPPIDAAKGYRLQDLGRGLYLVTDNAYQSMFLVHETGVVVVDAPPAYSKRLRQAIAEVTDRPVTHIVYSHAHIDHIGGASDLGGKPILVAHDETKRLLLRAKDPRRPIPTVTFKDRYVLKAGGQTLELSYRGVAHQPGNIFIWAPEQKTLMVVDVVFPGWMPWRRFALAQDVPGYFQQVAEIDEIPFETFVGGHVGRVGTHADVRAQRAFMVDLKAAASAALQSTAPGAEIDPDDRTNPWAVFDNYIDRVAAKCVNALTPTWRTRLAAFDVYIWDQCYAMEQSLRID